MWYIQNRKDFWVLRQKKIKWRESVVMVTHHNKESISSIGMALKPTMRTKKGELPLLFVRMKSKFQTQEPEHTYSSLYLNWIWNYFMYYLTKVYGRQGNTFAHVHLLEKKPRIFTFSSKPYTALHSASILDGFVIHFTDRRISFTFFFRRPPSDFMFTKVTCCRQR